MLDTFQHLVSHQLQAALCTLNACIERCPEAAWNAKVGNCPFCQVAFHTLFYADYYLGPNDESFREQPFHQGNAEFFADYEEFEDREPVRLYDKPSIRRYLQHCREKAAQMIAAETEETLTARAAFPRRDFSRAELYVYNIRHIQHHAAQLSLRLRIDHGIEVPWIGVGWREIEKP
jgi:hypothetical protein